MATEDRNYFMDLLIEVKKKEEDLYKGAGREKPNAPHRPPKLNPRIKM